MVNDLRIPRIHCQETVKKSTAQLGLIWRQLTPNSGVYLNAGVFSLPEQSNELLRCVGTGK